MVDIPIQEAADKKNGFIVGKNRQGQAIRFPLMTITIAIVTNEQRTFANTLEASEVAAELKDYAKTNPSSLYVVDKRRSADVVCPNRQSRFFIP
jgi:hypothetical protein